MPQAVDPQHTADYGAAVIRLVDEVFPLVEGLYIDLHHNPELSHAEHRTARAVAEWLSRSGYEVAEGVGGTGVVGVLRNGEGPTVLLRGDMDALPMEEQTGLPYASTARGVDENGDDVPVMHACGHDVHTACLVGAADLLATARDHWRGTLVIAAQPAEETAAGAAAMLEDGLYERFGRPDIALAQHVGPHPAGMIAHRRGVALASCGRMRVRVFGVGGHGAQPHTAVDPVVIAANIVTRLQSVVAREVDPTEMAVVTVGVLKAGSKANIIPDEAYLEINTRAFDDRVGEQVRTAVERVIRAEAAAAGAPREPEIIRDQELGATSNDPESTTAVTAAHRAYFGESHVLDLPEPMSGSEDFGLLALPGDPDPVPCVLWFLGATPHEIWEKAEGDSPFEKLGEVPAPHSPFFAPDRETTLRSGLAALTVGALTYLARPDTPAGALPPPQAWTADYTPPPPEELGGLEEEPGTGAAPSWAEAEATEESAMEAAMEGFDDGAAAPPAGALPPPQGPPVYAPPPPQGGPSPSTGPHEALPDAAPEGPPYQL